MKRFILLVVLCFHVFVLFAQQDVTTFLGIPVDGTKPEMIAKLKEKGFVYSSHSDNLRGEFNGEEVEIRVVTNNNKVWRIAVFDKRFRDEQQIKIRYNELCRQFSNNKRYTSFLNKDSSYVIPYDEDISYEMSVNEKLYQASFYQNPDSVTFFNNPIMQRECPTVYKAVSEIGISNLRKDGDLLSEYVKGFSRDEALNFIPEFFRMNSFLWKKSVWFQISYLRYDEYFIVMFYDNKYNEANGEDL